MTRCAHSAGGVATDTTSAPSPRVAPTTPPAAPRAAWVWHRPADEALLLDKMRELIARREDRTA